MPDSKQPRISDLTARLLGHTVDAETLASAADAFGEVQPHEVSVGFRADPRVAWKESLEVLDAFGLPVPQISVPADWGALVVKHDNLFALPFALANYPQRVRELGTLQQAKELSSLLGETNESSSASSGLTKWAARLTENTDAINMLVAAANFRAAGDHERAEQSLPKRIPAELQIVLGNERAALLWHKGDYAAADAAWAKLPDTVPVRFNRGMAALFLGRPAEAVAHLRAAIDALPDASAWHHLANLYCTLAEMRK